MSEILRRIREIVAEHLDEKRTALQMRIVWDGERVQELAPWEPF